MNTTKRSTVRTFLIVSLLLSFLMLGAAWIAPVALRAGTDTKQPQNKRYYDKNNKDYHEWNANEDHAYRAYLGENHQEYRDFAKVKAPQQQAYFDWRHQHPDSALINVEIR